MNDVILIDGGDVFEGNWQQLAEEYDLMDESDLVDFCIDFDCVYEVRPIVLH